MQPFRKLFEVLQFNSKPTINFAVLTYYKADALAKPCVGDNPIVATLKKEFTLLLDRSSLLHLQKLITGWPRSWTLISKGSNFCLSLLGMKFRSRKHCFLMSISGHCKIWQKSQQKFHKLKSLIPPKREKGWKGHKIRSVISAMGPPAVLIPTVCQPVSTTKTFYARCVAVCFVSILHRLFRLQEQLLV